MNILRSLILSLIHMLTALMHVQTKGNSILRKKNNFNGQIEEASAE